MDLLFAVMRDEIGSQLWGIDQIQVTGTCAKKSVTWACIYTYMLLAAGPNRNCSCGQSPVLSWLPASESSSPVGFQIRRGSCARRSAKCLVCRNPRKQNSSVLSQAVNDSCVNTLLRGYAPTSRVIVLHWHCFGIHRHTKCRQLIVTVRPKELSRLSWYPMSVPGCMFSVSRSTKGKNAHLRRLHEVWVSLHLSLK